MCIGKMDPLGPTDRHNFGFIDTEGQPWRHKNLPHCGPGVIEHYESEDCEDYRTRYIPTEDLLVMADWFEEHYPISDHLLSINPTFHPSEATDVEDLRGLRKYDDNNWLMSVYPEHAVCQVQKRACEVMEQNPTDESACSIWDMADRWLAGCGGKSFVEVCPECWDCINHGEWDVDEEPTVYERLEKRWPNHDHWVGWPYDPTTKPGWDDHRTTEFTRSHCQGCGRHPAAARYKMTFQPRMHRTE
jgi:hypothetical protein